MWSDYLTRLLPNSRTKLLLMSGCCSLHSTALTTFWLIYCFSLNIALLMYLFVINYSIYKVLILGCVILISYLFLLHILLGFYCCVYTESWVTVFCSYHVMV